MTYRQTNHNGRVSAKSGSAYNKNHNDRNFDISHAKNIHSEMTSQNIVIHYDSKNRPTVIDMSNPSHLSIAEHEHNIYKELFAESLSKQHARNEAARHPERNKSIDNLLENKNTCPEETIFQIGSVEDGFPPVETLMEIFEDYQKKLIDSYGDNLHFLDVVLHMDEAVPHIHIRKVWTYDGKDGLDISQNKALSEMGFERPDPDKPSNKWNNAKVTFSEWEREMKLSICENHNVEVAWDSKTPGKRSLEKEEAIALKLQKKINSLEKELITEEMKNKEVPNTNIFGKPKNLTVSPEEYRSWQHSAETKENNERVLSYIKEQKELLHAREIHLNKLGGELAKERLAIDSEVNKRVEDRINAELPSAVIRLRKEAESLKREALNELKELNKRSDELDRYAMHLHDTETYLDDVSIKLQKRKKNLDNEVQKSVAQIIKDTFLDFFESIKKSFLSHLKGKHQEDVISVIKDMPIDYETANRLFKYGYSNAEHYTVGELLERAQEEDIKDALHEAGASYRSITMADIETVKQGFTSDKSLDEIMTMVSNTISNTAVNNRHR